MQVQCHKHFNKQLSAVKSLEYPVHRNVILLIKHVITEHPLIHDVPKHLRVLNVGVLRKLLFRRCEFISGDLGEVQGILQGCWLVLDEVELYVFNFDFLLMRQLFCGTFLGDQALVWI